MAFRGTVHVRFRKGVSLPHITDVIDQIGKLAGCSPCGLLGVDLRLTGDPEELGQLAKLPGVNSVRFGE